MKKVLLLISSFSLYLNAFSQNNSWNINTAEHLSKMPLKCIFQEYPNKTGHVIMDENDAHLTPAQLHPSFYGCLDWHSSVHGHWMLVKILKDFPQIPTRDEIINTLRTSFQPEKIIAEVEYFNKYPIAKSFERTYGWAWLLKLDEELRTWQHPLGQEWAQNLQPLTDKIVDLWQDYLPKQTYANHTGVHPNSAFGLAFAWDWANKTNNQEFKLQIESQIKRFYHHLSNYKAMLEPDGSDFFSNSLFISDAMTRILSPQDYRKWFDSFLNSEDIAHLSSEVIISDRMDYQITHLDGLMFSRAWNLHNIAQHLGQSDPRYKLMREKADILIQKAISNLDKGNYGGEHWLASFAVYALTR